MVIKDDACNQNTIVADYNALISKDKVDLLLGTFSSLLNLPASAVAERNRMLFVEPAGGAPELFDRGFKYLFFAQQATADKQGDVWANYVTELPADQRPEDRRLPDARRPVRAADLGGHREDPQRRGHQDRLPRDLHDRQREPRLDRQRGQVHQGRPRRQRRDLRGRRRPGPLAAKANYTPKMLYQTTAPSLGDQYAKAIGKETTEGIFYAVSHSKEAETPGNAEFVAKYEEMYGGSEVPEDAADAFAAAEVMAAAVEAVKASIDDQTQAGRLAARERGRHDPRPAELGRGGAARGRVPRRPVAERRAGDRPAQGGRDVRQDHCRPGSPSRTRG